MQYDGRTYESPSHAGTEIAGRRVSGWYFWKYKKNGKWVRLGKIRKG